MSNGKNAVMLTFWAGPYTADTAVATAISAQAPATTSHHASLGCGRRRATHSP